MTKKEVTEIMGVLMIAYPAAELFRASSEDELEQKLRPTIDLWAAALSDIDYWDALHGVLTQIQTNKFLPSIAEVRASALDFRRQTNKEIDDAFKQVKQALFLTHGNHDEAMGLITIRSRKVIQAMGGMSELLPKKGHRLNSAGFAAKYEEFLRRNPIALPTGGNQP